MDTEIRLSAQTLKVLGVLLSASTDSLSGAEIGRTTRLRSGTLYPILARLENAGWVQSNWENADPHELGRPRRRFYKITGVGSRKAKIAIKDIAAVGGFAWSS